MNHISFRSIAVFLFFLICLFGCDSGGGSGSDDNILCFWRDNPFHDTFIIVWNDGYEYDLDVDCGIVDSGTITVTSQHGTDSIRYYNVKCDQSWRVESFTCEINGTEYIYPEDKCSSYDSNGNNSDYGALTFCWETDLCSSEGIVTIAVDIYKDGNDEVASAAYVCPDGSGTIDNLETGGSYRILISGIIPEGTIMYQGEKSGITINGGMTTDVGTIVMAEVSLL